MDHNISEKQRIQKWLDGPYDHESKDFIRKMLKENSEELFDAFASTLNFGTGGIRAKMGIGSNRLNKYTIGIATQALSNYIKQQNERNPSVLIGFDNRKNSDFFAKEAAKVLAANDVKVYLLNELRPTPIVSFGCRYKKCTAAIMITASHNPKYYNGYKVYWSDGGQVLPPHDVGIISEYNKIESIEEVKIIESLESPLIEIITDELVSAYEEALFSCTIFQKKETENDLKIIYSSLHGAGITLTPKCLNKAGFDNVIIVKEQEKPDPNFTNAPKPNPEEKQALEIGIRYLLDHNADIFISNDPDADRMGVVINHNQQVHILTGNQVACLILDFLCSALNVSPNTACIKSIVTTELLTKIAEFYKIKIFNVLTGFKYIAERIFHWEHECSYDFLFGAEESLGYLVESFVRDKDAISASIIISKIALRAKREGKTLINLIYDLYKKHGIYREKLSSINVEATEVGMQQMKTIMETFRSNPPKTIANQEITLIEDYQKQVSYDLVDNKEITLELPKSNVLAFTLSDSSKVIIRPSGTEPKMKIYASTYMANVEDIIKDIEISDVRLDALIDAVRCQIKT